MYKCNRNTNTRDSIIKKYHNKKLDKFVLDNDELDMNKIKYAAEVLQRISRSNSVEIFTFRKQLAGQVLRADNPLECLSTIEDIFIKSNIPTVGKIYSCFETLHPNFEGFDFNVSHYFFFWNRNTCNKRKRLSNKRCKGYI